MTVAAVILAASVDSALADANGLPAVRRIADVAWSGGATPIVVVAFDPEGGVATALAGAPVTLAEPAPVEGGPVAQIRRGIEVAASEIAGLDGAFIWPARLTWVGPETITSLIEAHGLEPGVILRPAFEGQPGWPALIPMRHVAALGPIAPDRMPDEVLIDISTAGIRVRTIELGDPGATHDRSVAFADLPPYVGPTEPVHEHKHEWGAPIADQPDDAPVPGPAIARYPSEG